MTIRITVDGNEATECTINGEPVSYAEAYAAMLSEDPISAVMFTRLGVKRRSAEPGRPAEPRERTTSDE